MNYKRIGHIEVNPKVCCEMCDEIYAMRMDCPVCQTENAVVDAWSDASSESPDHRLPYVIICRSCTSAFLTRDYPFSNKSVWYQMISPNESDKNILLHLKNYLSYADAAADQTNKE